MNLGRAAASFGYLRAYSFFPRLLGHDKMVTVRNTTTMQNQANFFIQSIILCNGNLHNSTVVVNVCERETGCAWERAGER